MEVFFMQLMALALTLTSISLLSNAAPDVRPMYALVNTQNVSMNWTLELCEPERIIVIRQYYPDNNYREIIKPFSCANFTRHFDNEAGIYDEAQKNFSGFVVARSGKMLSLVFRNITKEEEGPYELEIQRQEQYPKRPLMVLEAADLVEKLELDGKQIVLNHTAVFSNETDLKRLAVTPGDKTPGAQLVVYSNPSRHIAIIQNCTQSGVKSSCQLDLKPSMRFSHTERGLEVVIKYPEVHGLQNIILLHAVLPGYAVTEQVTTKPVSLIITLCVTLPVSVIIIGVLLYILRRNRKGCCWPPYPPNPQPDTFLIGWEEKVNKAIELMTDVKRLLNKDIAIESSDIDSDLQALRSSHSNMQESKDNLQDFERRFTSCHMEVPFELNKTVLDIIRIAQKSEAHMGSLEIAKKNSLAYDAIDDISASVRSEILIWWHGRIHPASSESDFFDKMATRNRDWKNDHRDTTLDWHCSVIGSVCALGIAEGSSGCYKVEAELFQACCNNLRLLRKHGELDEDTFRRICCNKDIGGAMYYSLMWCPIFQYVTSEGAASLETGKILFHRNDLKNESVLQRKLGDLMREDIENGGALQIWLRRSMLHSWTRDPMFCHALTKAICDLTWSTDSTDVSTSLVVLLLKYIPAGTGDILFAIQQWVMEADHTDEQFSQILKMFYQHNQITGHMMTSWLNDNRQTWERLRCWKIISQWLADTLEQNEIEADGYRHLEDVNSQLEIFFSELTKRVRDEHIERSIIDWIDKDGRFKNLVGCRNFVKSLVTGVLKSLLFLGRLEEIDRYKSLLLRYTSNIHEKLEVLTALMELGFAFTDEQLGSVCMQLVDVEVINWQILVRWSNQKGEDSERIGRIFRETKGLKQWTDLLEKMKSVDSLAVDDVVCMVNAEVPQPWLQENDEFLKELLKHILEASFSADYKILEADTFLSYSRVLWSVLQHSTSREVKCIEMLEIILREHNVRLEIVVRLMQWGNILSYDAIKRWSDNCLYDPTGNMTSIYHDNEYWKIANMNLPWVDLDQ